MCQTCGTPNCSCEQKKSFLIPYAPYEEAQPVNPNFVITYNKFQDQRLSEHKGAFQIVFNVPDSASKVMQITWKFASQAHRDTAWDNLKNVVCLSV